MKFGDILRNLIEDRGITQKKLATDLNIAPTTLGNYIRNLREPDFDTLKLFARYFHVSTDYLLNHQTRQTESHQEDELLQVFRSLSKQHQEIYLKQGKAFPKK